LLLKYKRDEIRTNNQLSINQIQAALLSVEQHLNGANRITQLSNLETQATNVVQDFFPGINLHLQVSTPDVDELMKGATISM